jgi:REP element-mobilizing transposase RayT
MDHEEDQESNPSRKTLSFFDSEAETVKAHGAFLPHWIQSHEVMYFVTFRLADSLPQERLLQLSKEKAKWLEEHPESRSDEEEKAYRRRFSRQLQGWLDAGYGSMILLRPEVKLLVENALRHFEGKRYCLDEFVVAGNHVHVLVTPKTGHFLSEILHSWKGYTASAIGKLGTSGKERGGPLWQQESWDHLVRSETSLEKFRRYIRAH